MIGEVEAFRHSLQADRSESWKERLTRPPRLTKSKPVPALRLINTPLIVGRAEVP